MKDKIIIGGILTRTTSPETQYTFSIRTSTPETINLIKQSVTLHLSTLYPKYEIVTEKAYYDKKVKEWKKDI